MAARPKQLLHYLRRLAGPAEPATPDSDGALLRRFSRLRDEAAFAALVHRHGPLVLGVCRRVLRDADAAEDAFQATFLVLATKAAALRRPEGLAAWLYGTAHRLALRRRRTESRQQQREARGLLASPARHPPSPLDELSARELLLILDEEIHALPEVYRLPIILCCLEGKTQEEAARQLGWSAGQVKGRLERGRGRLHARLTKRGLDLAVALAAAGLARGLVTAAPPAQLIELLLRAATSGAAEGANITAEVARLAAEEMKQMNLTKLKCGLALVLAAGLVAGTGLLAQVPGVRPDDRAQTEARAGQEERPRPAEALGKKAAWRGAVRLPQGEFVYAAVFSPDGKLLASAGEGPVIKIWDVAAAKAVRALRVPAPPAPPLGRGGYVLSPAQVRQMRGLPLFVPALAFSPDGKFLASGDNDGSIHLWDVASGKSVRHWTALVGPLHERRLNSWVVSCVAFASDGQTLGSAGTDGTVRLWEVATGRQSGVLLGLPATDLVTLAFAPNGRYLVAGGGEEQPLQRWGRLAGIKKVALQKDRDFVFTVAYSADGKALAAGERRGVIRLWNMNTGQESHRWDSGQGDLRALAFAPGGKVLAAQGSTRGVRLWDAATGKELARPAGGQEYGGPVAFSPDGRYLAAGGGDGTVILWEVARLLAGEDVQAPPAPASRPSAPRLQPLWAALHTLPPDRDEPDRGPTAKPTLWASLSVNQPVFQEGDTDRLNLSFALVNDGAKLINPKVSRSKLVVNGKALADSDFLLGNGPRDARFEALSPGDHLLFGYALGKVFARPGSYRVCWEGEGFRSAEITFRVLPKKQ